MTGIPVHLTGIDADALEPHTSLDIEDIGSGQGSDTKLIMKVSRATDATIDAVKEIDLIYDLDAAKLYCGKSSDVMVILYLNSYDVLSEADLRTIIHSIPHIVPFRPHEARDPHNEDGWLWSGSTHMGDSIARKLV